MQLRESSNILLRVFYNPNKRQISYVLLHLFGLHKYFYMNLWQYCYYEHWFILPVHKNNLCSWCGYHFGLEAGTNCGRIRKEKETNSLLTNGAILSRKLLGRIELFSV